MAFPLNSVLLSFLCRDKGPKDLNGRKAGIRGCSSWPLDPVTSCLWRHSVSCSSLRISCRWLRGKKRSRKGLQSHHSLQEPAPTWFISCHFPYQPDPGTNPLIPKPSRDIADTNQGIQRASGTHHILAGPTLYTLSWHPFMCPSHENLFLPWLCCVILCISE